MPDELNGTLLGDLFQHVEACKIDYLKASKKSSKTAAARVRRRMLRIKKLSEDIREEMRNEKAKFKK